MTSTVSYYLRPRNRLSALSICLLSEFRARSLGGESVLESHCIASLDGYGNTLEIYCVSNGSDVTIVDHFPISCTSFAACAFHGPPVSFATGKNKCVRLNLSYFAVLLTAALSAAAPAVTEVFGRCDGAKVSGTVTSHARGLPCAQGISVAPSGRFQSSRVRPRSSLTAGICAFLIAL